MPDSRPSRKSPVLPVVVALVAAVALVATLAGAFSGGEDGADDRAASSEAPGSAGSSDSEGSGGSGNDALARRQSDDPMAKGDVDAPVVLVAYSDFQCPFCGKWARDTAPRLEEKYVADGALRIEWRDFPYLGQESTTAALAGRAAAAQGAFWEFHDAMYADQLPPNSGKLDDRYVEGIADHIGLDVQQFRDDMASEDARELVNADFLEGQALGITGTPSFVINGVPVVGAQPIEVFEQVIEQAAAG